MNIYEDTDDFQHKKRYNFETNLVTPTFFSPQLFL